MGSTTFRKTVAVQGEVLIRLPATMEGREWQLTGFDSYVLMATATLQLEERGGHPEWVGRFVAQNPGETDVEYTRVAALPNAQESIGERRVYRFRVRE